MSATTLDVQLVLVRSLYDRAVVAAQTGGDIDTMTTVLLLDVAAETATKLAWQHAPGAPKVKNDAGIGAYIAALTTLQRFNKLANAPETVAVKKLRDARNDVQHAGSVLAATDVKRRVREVERYLRLLVRLAFKRNFDRVSVVSLVADSQIRGLLERARQEREAKRIVAAMAWAAGAFEVLAIRWARAIREADGYDSRNEEYCTRESPLLKWCGLSYMVPEPEEDIWRVPALLAMGFSVEELSSLRALSKMDLGLIGEADKLFTTAEADGMVECVARQAWRLESLHPQLFVKRTELPPLPQQQQPPSGGESKGS